MTGKPSRTKLGNVSKGTKRPRNGSAVDVPEKITLNVSNGSHTGMADLGETSSQPFVPPVIKKAMEDIKLMYALVTDSPAGSISDTDKDRQYLALFGALTTLSYEAEQLPLLYSPDKVKLLWVHALRLWPADRMSRIKDWCQKTVNDLANPPTIWQWSLAPDLLPYTMRRPVESVLKDRIAKAGRSLAAEAANPLSQGLRSAQPLSHLVERQEGDTSSPQSLLRIPVGPRPKRPAEDDTEMTDASPASKQMKQSHTGTVHGEELTDIRHMHKTLTRICDLIDPLTNRPAAAFWADHAAKLLSVSLEKVPALKFDQLIKLILFSKIKDHQLKFKVQHSLYDATSSVDNMLSLLREGNTDADRMLF